MVTWLKVIYPFRRLSCNHSALANELHDFFLEHPVINNGELVIVLSRSVTPRRDDKAIMAFRLVEDKTKSSNSVTLFPSLLYSSQLFLSNFKKTNRANDQRTHVRRNVYRNQASCGLCEYEWSTAPLCGQDEKLA